MASTAPPRICTDYEVIVLDHARFRARERFPGYKAARIVDEVHEALAAGRFSTLKPEGLIGGDYPGGFYAWTPDGERIFGLACGQEKIFVRTVMRKGVHS